MGKIKEEADNTQTNHFNNNYSCIFSNKRFYFIFTVFIMLLSLLVIPNVKATSIGISPGNVVFNNMLKGGYAENTVIISTNSVDSVVTSLYLKGDIKDWVTLVPDNRTFLMSSSEPYELKIIMQPPTDARSDYYTGSIDFITERYGEMTGRAGGFVRAGVTMRLETTVSDDEIIACRSGAFNLDDIEYGDPIRLSSTIINDGNVRIRPSITYDIWNQDQTRLVISGSFESPEILPTTRVNVVQNIPNSLSIGQYWAIIKTEDCGQSDLLTFSVVERGSIIDKGVLERITNPLWVYSFEPIEIKAVFRNDGPRTVSAKFQGDIRLDNSIVGIIDTEEIDVPSNQKADIITYFTPDRPGKYVISGRVVYNRKLTYEKSSILNVNYPSAKRDANIIPFIIYIFILTTIIFLIRTIFITKRRKKNNNNA